jgi:hypothetical protein
MTSSKVVQMPAPARKSVVKGPIRCHKCQLLCVDADHYLTHACTPRVGRP